MISVAASFFVEHESVAAELQQQIHMSILQEPPARRNAAYLWISSAEKTCLTNKE